jgi:hypothetical protein
MDDYDPRSHEDPAALRRYRELVAGLSDRSAMTDDAFDLLAPGDDTQAEQRVWVPVVVTSRVVPQV